MHRKTVENHAKNEAARPHWDSERRQLMIGSAVVKRFRTAASCQQAILDAFEEEGWPARIDDPLPFLAGIPGDRRLHNAVNGLNRAHQVDLIRFGRDGTGEGILWEWA